MARSNDLMTALADTRGALENKIDALGERLEAARREVTDTATTQWNTRVSGLQADNREARDRLNGACDSLSEITASLPPLRQEVAGLAHTVAELRTAVGELLTRMPAGPQAAPPGDDAPAPGRPAPASAGTVREPAADPATEDAETVDAPAAPAPTGPEAEAGSLEEAARRQAACEAFRARQEEAPADGTPAPAAAAAPAYDGTDAGRELARHDAVLGAAATVGTVHLVCHRELWDFVREHAEHVPHFRAPAVPSEEGHDRLRVTLSGRSVIGVLTAMRATRTRSAKYGLADGTWSLSDGVYERLARDLTTTDRSGTTPLTVVFDDGVSEASDYR